MGDFDKVRCLFSDDVRQNHQHTKAHVGFAALDPDEVVAGQSCLSGQRPLRHTNLFSSGDKVPRQRQGQLVRNSIRVCCRRCIGRPFCNHRIENPVRRSHKIIALPHPLNSFKRDVTFGGGGNRPIRLFILVNLYKRFSEEEV